MQTSDETLDRTHSSLWSDLRALPGAAWMLFFGSFLNKFGAFVVPFLALYLTSAGYTLADAGLAESQEERIASTGYGRYNVSFGH